MKFKYFLRGFGVGIVFGALILFVAYQTSPNKLLTDEAVMNRARELGMVEKQSDLDKVIKSTTTESTTEQTSQTNTEQDVTKAQQEGATQETTGGQQEGTTQEVTGGQQEGTTQEVTTASEASTEKPETVTVKITKGMQSSAVAKTLEEKGIIENAADFDKYLNKNGYATKLRVGSYEIQKQASYTSIAKILTN